MNAAEELLRADIAARDAALDVQRSFIVQAPAGSGKTELLIQRYLRLLAIVEDPEEVLAITFTRKAAAEMHLRVLQALRLAQSGLQPDEAHQLVTADAAARVLSRDADRGWKLIDNPGRMRIQTLDALNASISRMQPMSFGNGASNNAIVADAEMRALYRDAAMLTLDQLTETGPLREATEEILRHVDSNTGLYVAYLRRMLATRDQWLPFVGSGLVDKPGEAALRARLQGNLERAVLDHLRRTREALPEALGEALLGLAHYAATRLTAAGKDDGPIGRLSSLDELPHARREDIDGWHCLAELLLTKQGKWRKTVTKAQGFPPGDDGQKRDMLELLAGLADASEFEELLHATRDLPPLAYTDEQWSVLLALFRLLPLAVTELKRLFAERAVTDYIEVALSAAAALGTADDPGDVALLLDYQLRHLLVDEMQDTSSAQYRMLEALTGGWQPGDGRTLFCVGDPMQSIYRFRNAEVGQFLLARQTGIGGVELESLTLRRNFRSGAGLVDWFNRVFPDVLAGKDDVLASAVAYSAAVSAVPGHGTCHVHPVFGSAPDGEAELGAGIIEETLRLHPGDDMVVLVRSRSHLAALLPLLRRANIAYRAVEIDRLTDLPEIIDVLALTRALVHRGDRLAWLALLRAPWLGLDWADLHALVSDAANATVWELLNDDSQLARLSSAGRDGAVRFRDSLQREMRPNLLSSLRDRVERTWLQLGGPAISGDAQAVENVYRFLDVIEKLETGGTLSDVAELESALDLEHVSSDMNARLQVMTMHRAKGLQFDHVLLYGLGRAPGRQQRAVLGWFDLPAERGVEEKVISPVGRRADVESDPVHRFIERVEAAKYRHELGRLLYVACTRARRSLHLLGHVEIARDGSTPSSPRAGSLLSLLWAAVANDYEQAFGDAPDPVSTAATEPWLRPELKRFDAPWSLPDFEGLHTEQDPGEFAEPGSEVEFYWVGAAARLAGTLVHRWLQLASDKRVVLSAGDMSQLRATSRRWLLGAGVSGDDAAPIVDRVETALRGMLEDDKGRWLLAGEGSAELALTGVYDKQVVSVVLDRVRIDEKGVHWIVDYKTSSHEGGDLEGFLAAEVERYRPQLQKYRHMYQAFTANDARCALYFPLLQEFVEVPL